jgi:hypothetical protein
MVSINRAEDQKDQKELIQNASQSQKQEVCRLDKSVQQLHVKELLAILVANRRTFQHLQKEKACHSEVGCEKTRQHASKK